MVYGKIDSSMVGVGEAVSVKVGTGDGVAVWMTRTVSEGAAREAVGGEGWQAAITNKKNRHAHCFMK